jgi:phosphatidylglycerol:prolipoprotein diacylglycerol transferase
LNAGLSDPFAGFAVGLIAMLVYGQRAKLSFWNTLDVLTPLLAVMTVGFAVSHIASGEAFGAETNLPWGINLWGANRHPTQFYELIAALAILALLGAWSKIPNVTAGILFLAFVALTAGSRLFLEAFRGDSLVIFGGLRSAQMIAWLVLAAALIGLDVMKRRSAQNG